MSLNLKTTMVTTTPYFVLPTDQVVFVDVAGLSSVVLPSDGIAKDEDCCGNKKHDDDHHDDHEHDRITGRVIKKVLDPLLGGEEPEPDKPTILYRSYYIKDFSGLAQTNPITITSAGGETIDGVSFAILNGGYSHIQVVFDGNEWKTIA